MNLAIEIIFIIVLLIILVVNGIVRQSARIFKDEENPTKLSGFEVAKAVATALDNPDVHIIKKHGKFLDFYHKDRNVIKLNDDVFDGTDMYATGMAFVVAYEIDKPKLYNTHKFASFMVLLSYVVMLLGAFLNNSLFLHFSFIVFILAFILEVISLNYLLKNDKAVAKINKLLNKLKIVPKDVKYEEYFLGFALLSIARLPYGFINYFR